MDVKDKVIEALREGLPDPYIRVEEDDGLSGFVVSPRFEGMSMLDRQSLIEEVFDHASHPLTDQEKRQVLIIAGLTPVESDAVGAGVRVHEIKEIADGWIEIRLHGGPSDAEYVREVFKSLAGVRTTEPQDSPGARGILMLFRAKSATADPLTKARALQALKNDPYITVTPGA